MRRRRPEPDGAPPRHALPARLPLLAPQHQMLPHHRDDLHGPAPGTVEMGGPIRPARPVRMAEIGTAEPEITVVAASALASHIVFVVVAYGGELRGPERQSGLAGRHDACRLLRR